MNINNRAGASELLKYIPRKTLDDLCKSIAEVTDFFTGIEDYSGQMISLSTGELSCKLCRQRRIRVADTLTCQRIDAFASIESARRRSAIMYICPYGLIDMCAPIIIGERVQGAVFMGQILTDREGMDSLQHFNIPIDDDSESENELLIQYEDEKKKLKTVPFTQLKSYLSLIEMAARYLSELGTRNMTEDELHHSENSMLQLEARNSQLERNSLFISNQLSGQLALSQFTIASLNSFNQMAVLEDAPETKKGLQDLMQLLQYISDSSNVFTSLDRELSHVDKYLELQRMINSRINVIVDFNVQSLDLIIPQLVLIRLLENSFQYAFTTECEDPLISLQIDEDEGNIVIVLKDNGVGIPGSVATDLLQYMLDSSNIPDQTGSMFLILRNMKYLYRDSFHFDIDSKRNEGTTLTLSIPNRRPEND